MQSLFFQIICCALGIAWYFQGNAAASSAFIAASLVIAALRPSRK